MFVTRYKVIKRTLRPIRLEAQRSGVPIEQDLCRAPYIYYARKFTTSVMLGFTLRQRRPDGGQKQKNFSLNLGVLTNIYTYVPLSLSESLGIGCNVAIHDLCL